jgi:threonine/homoserine/homoserine lactone efflux protein
MNTALLTSMFFFSLSMSISPGPVNMVIASSSMNYGAKKTMSFVSGATIGFTLLLIFIGFGFHKVVIAYPAVLKYLTVSGAAFIAYIGYKIATSKSDIQLERTSPANFMQGFMLQWLNAKAWIACLAGAAMFSNPETSLNLSLFIVIYFFVCYISLALWAVAGEQASSFLKRGNRLKIFNACMGFVLILSAIHILRGVF